MKSWRMLFSPVRLAVARCLAVLAATSAPAFAQESILLDPSARSGGMGGAATAVPWGGAADLWANPALITARPGFSVQVTSEQLLPGLLDDEHFNTTRLIASIAGLGFSSAGRPLGSTELEYGLAHLQFEPGGAFIPAPVGDESIRENGFGVSAAGLADAVGAVLGNRWNLTRWGDVTWGRQWKRIRQNVSDLYRSDVSTYDDGWLARLAPYDSRRGAGAPVGGLRVEIAYGHADLDANSPMLGYVFGGVASSGWQVRHDGGAVRLAWFGPARGGEPAAAFADAFRGGLGPLVDLTLACDREHAWRPGSGEEYRARHYGAEATLLRVMTARLGYLHNPAGQVSKPTWGLGACLPLSRNGEVRYDFASWPQADSRRVCRHEVSLRVDPLAGWFGRRDPGSEQGPEN